MSRAHPFFVKFRGFKDNFPETTEYIGFKFSQITEIVCPFDIQLVPLVAWSENKKQMLMGKKWKQRFACRAFSYSRGQNLCKFMGTKESLYIRKEFNSPRTQGTQRQFSENISSKHGFEIYNFRNIYCQSFCLPASPRIFEHLKNGIIGHF